ncbi:TonB-dependent receptor domain-containing protein [Sphingomonas sp. LHG3443-2]|uniref:TonB-dependent receptor domain-containing protein n=1 Tax=Sphingomonas sp. LHG3443-2 TaxID=2804639 RepID=UPI003CE90EE8
MNNKMLLSATALRTLAVGFAFTMGSFTAAQAQTAPPAQTETPTESSDPATLNPQSEVELESGQNDTADSNQVVVTGTRIRAPNLTSAVPITSVGVQDLLDSGNVSLGDALNDLPALRSTYSQANSTRFIGTSGLNLLDLRGLGTSRTLVLVNGRRHVTSTPGGSAVDTNTIPQALLERVDVITGGNSAIYGSDAVAGVVNFILKRDFEGLQARAQAGISSRGDRGSYVTTVTAGKNFFDNRVNVAGSFEFTRQEAVLNRQRISQTGAAPGQGPAGFYVTDTDIQCNTNAQGVPIPGSIPFCDPAVIRGSDGIPDRQYFDVGAPFGNLSGGTTVQVTCPAAVAPTNPNFAAVELRRSLVCTGQTSPTGGLLSRNFLFLDDGSLVVDPITADFRAVGGSRFGGLTSAGLEGGQLIPESERISGNILINGDISQGFKPFFEGKYVRIVADQASNQATFVNATLSPVFSFNNGFLTPQARQTLVNISAPGATSFTGFRFNYDLGTRSEINTRETYRAVAGFRGDITASGSINYEVAGSYGRTDIKRDSGGNVVIANFNRASNAVVAPASFTGTNFVLNSQNQRVVCAVNADTSTTNDDPNCFPLNLFGQGNIDPRAANYVLYTSNFKARAEQLNFTGYVSGTSEGLFELPGGPIGGALGFEYRRETARSDSDDFTQSGATFLNAAAPFNPPPLNVYEAFAELRLPLLANRTLFHELTLEAAGRASDYNTRDDVVYAYNIGGIWAPVRDLRLRVGYARSVRAPDLGDLYQTPAQTFNTITDPCNQTVINDNPNRAARCAEAGIPTTVTLPDGTVRPFTNTSGANISGFNQGNPNLEPEIGKSFTVGAVFQPRWVPGFSLTVDYYNIEITKAISGLSGQAIVNACYEDPVTINNPFCAAVFRRPSTGNVFSDFTFAGQSSRTFAGLADVALPVTGPGFLNQPFNFSKLKTRGIDFDAAYRRKVGTADVNLRAIVSYLMNREYYTFISEPNRATNVVSVLGDPEWEANFSANIDFGKIAIGYDLKFIDRQLITAYENNFAFQGRQPTNVDAYPVRFYPRTFYHDARVTFEPDNNKFRFYVGVDNILDTLPPFNATGTGEGSAIFGNIGRYFYSGVEVRF